MRNIKNISFLRLLFLLWLLGVCACKTKTKQEADFDANNTGGSAVVDSLILKAKSASPDETLVLLYQIKQLASVTENEDLLFYAFNRSALIYSTNKDDFDAAKKQLDSAAQLNIAKSEKELAALNLRYGMIYKYSDSSVYFIKKALRERELLSVDDQRLAYATLAIFFYNHKNNVFADQYVHDYLCLPIDNQNIAHIRDRISVLNTSYLIKANLNDSAAAFAALQEALLTSEKHFPENVNFSVYQNMGKYYLSRQVFDSAYFYFSKFAHRLKRDFDKDYAFYPYTYYAEIALAQQDYALSKKYLDTAVSYLNPDKVQDPFIQFEYFQTLSELEKKLNNTDAALLALEKSNLYKDQLNNQDAGQQLIFLQNQIKEAEADKAIQERQNKLDRQRWYTLGLLAGCIAIITIATISILYWRKAKQLESEKLAQAKKQAELEKASLLIEVEHKERKRIAKELHDEMGSTITSIGLATRSLKRVKGLPEKPVEILERNSNALTQQAREIVWSLNDKNDNLRSLISFIHHHATQFLTDANFELQYSEPELVPEITVESYKRRYIFQTVKEILNNAVKYSKGTAITLVVEMSNQQLTINIKDNGIGLPKTNNTIGNGLLNIVSNIEALNGRVNFFSDDGTLIQLNIPL